MARERVRKWQPSMPEQASYGRLAGFVVRLLVFLAYFVASIVIMGSNMGLSKTQCWVQTTYRQEFLVNVVSNPFFSSLNVLRRAPLSKLERKYFNSANFTQNVSSVFAFPAQIDDALRKAAFLTVHPEPAPLLAAGETIMIPAGVTDNAYYFNQESGRVWSYEQNPSVNPASALARGTLDTMLRISGQTPHVGMQLPNLGRCIPPPDQAGLGSQETLLDWTKQLDNLEHRSQRLGTCLLTGQQPTVDLSSNARTSVLPFSSVNVIFMVGIVLWITASFALFHVGGWLKSDLEFTLPQHPEVLQGNKTVACCGCWPAYSDEAFMAVAVIWNVFPLFFILDRGYRENYMIPLNNAILAVSALLVSILVQCNWANFHAFDVEIHEAVARSVVLRMQDNRPQVRVDADKAKEQGEAAGPREADVPVGKPVAQAVSFTTVNFLSTASMVRDYGLSYARSAMQTPPAAAGGLRRRGRNGAFDEEGAYHSQPVTRRGKLGAAMPYYTALVRTGVPFAQYNYTNLIDVSPCAVIARAVDHPQQYTCAFSWTDNG